MKKKYFVSYVGGNDSQLMMGFGNVFVECKPLDSAPAIRALEKELSSKEKKICILHFQEISGNIR